LTVHDTLLARQFLEHVAHGATLGDMLNFEKRDYDIIYTLGHTLYVQRRFAEAARIFGFLVCHNHLERGYIEAYAAALQMSEDHVNAIRCYTLASMMDMTDPAPFLHTCECLIALGLKKEAAEGLAIVIQQCEGESHIELRRRAQMLLEMITQPAASAAEKERP
jgi:type III secretion system low calcium response chaperone LcrH/SycD